MSILTNHLRDLRCIDSAIDNTRNIISAKSNTLCKFSHVNIIINHGFFYFFTPCRKNSFHFSTSFRLLPFVVYICCLHLFKTALE
nr:MAG TPA: Magnesium transporter MRS2, mitochondrial transport, matrix located domain [Caudoviricetes sp.]